MEVESDRPRIFTNWTHPGLRITRLRLISSIGFPMWDVSYCHGVLDDGTRVRVVLPFSQLPKQSLMGALYSECVRAGLNGKKLNIYNAVDKFQ